jgi:hypothetical protein
MTLATTRPAGYAKPIHGAYWKHLRGMALDSLVKQRELELGIVARHLMRERAGTFDWRRQ